MRAENLLSFYVWNKNKDKIDLLLNAILFLINTQKYLFNASWSYPIISKLLKFFSDFKYILFSYNYWCSKCSMSCFEFSILYLFIVSWILLQKVISKKVMFSLFLDNFSFSCIKCFDENTPWISARAFFNSFREDHEMIHSRDLQKLEGVLSPSHLEVNLLGPLYYDFCHVQCFDAILITYFLFLCRRWNLHILWDKAKLI